MNYTLKLDLVGADNIEGVLTKLSNMTAALSGGGSGGGSTSPTQKLANDLERAKGSASGLKKEIQSIGTAAAQGFKGTGYGKSTVDFLKGLTEAKRAMVLSANPDLQKIWESQFSQASGGSGSKLKNKLRGDMKEAMDDLARHGGSQKIIDQIAQIAMGDAALNNYKGKTPPVIPTIDKKGLVTGIVASLFNPFVGARMLSNALPNGILGGSGGGGKGGGNSFFGMAGAMGYGEFFIVAKTLRVILEQLAKAALEVLKSFERARELYAKSLLSGLGLEFTSKRSMMASIIGVSEKDVVQFGGAMAYLDSRLQGAAKIMAQTTPQLASVSYEFGILKADLNALFAKLAMDVVPIVKIFAQGLDLIVVSITKLLDSSAFKSFLKAMALTGIGGTMSPALNALLNVSSAAAKIVAGGGLPNPESHMRQMPASAWERIGLVVGGGMGSATNDLIRISNRELKKISAEIGKIAAAAVGQSINPLGQFPLVNNP